MTLILSTIVAGALILSTTSLIAIIQLSNIVGTLVEHLGIINGEIGEIRDILRDLVLILRK